MNKRRRSLEKLCRRLSSAFLKWSNLKPVCGIHVVKRENHRFSAVIFSRWWTRGGSNSRTFRMRTERSPAPYSFCPWNKRILRAHDWIVKVIVSQCTLVMKVSCIPQQE